MYASSCEYFMEFGSVDLELSWIRNGVLRVAVDFESMASNRCLRLHQLTWFCDEVARVFRVDLVFSPG